RAPPDGGPGQRFGTDESNSKKEGAAGGELHGQQGERGDVVDDLLADDSADAPPGARDDQGRDRDARGRCAQRGSVNGHGDAPTKNEKWAGLSVGAEDSAP